MLKKLFSLAFLKRFYPVIAFFGGFLWDALTLGQRMRPQDFGRLGFFLIASGALVLWLARREARAIEAPRPEESWRGRWRAMRWEVPNLLLPFFYGGIFSALFILYFKSSGHLATWAMAFFLAVLLVANEFMGKRYGRKFTLNFALFALCAILLGNFVLPHAAGSLSPLWFYVSTLAGAFLTHGLYLVTPGRPGRILPAWGVAAALLIAWNLGMIAPVPLVKRDVVVGQQFLQQGGAYGLTLEAPPEWQFWRDYAALAHVPEGGKLYGVSAIFAPKGVTALLEHRWERKEANGDWRVVSRINFQATGGRDRGFRGYSWVLNPLPGDWRLVVGTQDGRTIATEKFRVERGEPDKDGLVEKTY